MRKGSAILILLLFPTLAGISSCGGGVEKKAGAAAPTLVVVEKVERRDVPLIVEMVARTEAVATVEIRANVEGQLIAMSFQEGRMVDKGQTLFRIDPRRYEAAVQLAKAAVEKAEGDLDLAREQSRLAAAEADLLQAEAGLLEANQEVERLKPLAERRAVPQRDLDGAIATQSSARAIAERARVSVRSARVGERVGVRQAEAQLAGAKAALAKAELDLEETTIRAPLAGLIGRLEVSVGNYVGRGQPSLLATISQLDPMKVIFSIPEALYLRVTAEGPDRAGLNAIGLVLSDNSTYPHHGRFAMIDRAVDAKTGSLAVEARFPNPKGLLLPGMFGRVRVAAETRRGAVLVPERALFDVQGSKAVYVVTSVKTAALRSVTVEGSYQGESIITSGLAAGETVVVEGIVKLRPGMRVAPASAGAVPKNSELN
jgi:membrane fusion protein (multidrug efflux system)